MRFTLTLTLTLVSMPSLALAHPGHSHLVGGHAGEVMLAIAAGSLLFGFLVRHWGSR